jgi:hypothetical protein
MAARSSRVVMLLAGEEAQRRFNPKSIRKYHAAADHGSVIEVLTRLHLDAEECRCAFRYLLARTRNLISNPWYRRRIYGARVVLEAIGPDEHQALNKLELLLRSFRDEERAR